MKKDYKSKYLVYFFDGMIVAKKMQMSDIQSFTDAKFNMLIKAYDYKMVKGKWVDKTDHLQQSFLRVVAIEKGTLFHDGVFYHNNRSVFFKLGMFFSPSESEHNLSCVKKSIKIFSIEYIEYLKGFFAGKLFNTATLSTYYKALL